MAATSTATCGNRHLPQRSSVSSAAPKWLGEPTAAQTRSAPGAAGAQPVRLPGSLLMPNSAAAAASSSSASRRMLSPRNLSLAAVCAGSTLTAIILHVSQASRKAGEPQYKTSSAVLLSEVGKLVFSVALALWAIVSKRRSQAIALGASPPPPKWSPLSGSGSSAEDEKRQRTWSNDLRLDVQFDDGSSTAAHSVQSLSPASTLVERSDSSPPKFDTFARPSTKELLQHERRASLVFDSSSSTPSVVRSLRQEVFGGDWLKMAVPAVLFAVQNNLIYVAARNLSIPVFQISFQIKTIMTALAAVAMLRRRLSGPQWLSLFALAIGVATIQLGAIATKQQGGDSNGSSSSTRHDESAHSNMNPLAGLSAVLISSACSAFAATYFELAIKRPAAASADNGSPQAPPTVWVRNIQLSLFSIVIGVVISAWQVVPTAFVSVTSMPAASANAVLASAQQHWYSPATDVAVSFFAGFDRLAWLVVLLQSVGGLLIALALRYADNVAKGFAVSLSIVFTTLLSVVLFNFHASATTVIGGLVVVSSTFLFEAGNGATFSEALAKVIPGDLSQPQQPRRRNGWQSLLVLLLVCLAGLALVLAPLRQSAIQSATDLLSATHGGGGAVSWTSLRQQSPLALQSPAPTIAVADMGRINAVMAKVSDVGDGTCGWGKYPARWSTTAPYGERSDEAQAMLDAQFPFWHAETDQYALDNILATRMMDYAQRVPLFSDPPPDFIYLPIIGQTLANPWGCDAPDLKSGIRETIDFVRSMAASIDNSTSTYPRLILPIAVIRSILEDSLLTPEIQRELADKVVMVGIEGAPRSPELMKYVIDLPYPTHFHLAEKWDVEAIRAQDPRASLSDNDRTEVGDFFLNQERPYLLHYAASSSHPWGTPLSDPFNGFRLRAVIRDNVVAHIESPSYGSAETPKLIFDDISKPQDGEQDLMLFYRHMMRSTFCPQPAGDSPTRRGFYDALLMGCIPVIFREKSYGRLLPSSPDMDVSKYTVFIDETELLNGEGGTLIERLGAIPPKEVRRMQRHIAQVASRLQWSMPTVTEFFPEDPNHTKPEWDIEVTRARKAGTPGFSNDAFGALLHELNTIKSGKWQKPIVRDLRSGVSFKHFGRSV